MTDSPVSPHTLSITGCITRIDTVDRKVWIHLTSPRALAGDFAPFAYAHEIETFQRTPFAIGAKITGKATYVKIAGENRLRITELVQIAPSSKRI